MRLMNDVSEVGEGSGVIFRCKSIIKIRVIGSWYDSCLLRLGCMVAGSDTE